MPDKKLNAECLRLQEAREQVSLWKKWGPYLSERQWGTVREDYSLDGDAWNYFSHDQARSRAYHWGEDGLAGISDEKQQLCFSLALWNGKDPILKERLFGLTNSESNHGEDVKEYYFYIESTPTHSYMKYLYKYPHAAFPYDDLVATSRSRSRTEPEYELLDTGVFEGDRYFDVFVEYAKDSAEDMLIKISYATVDQTRPRYTCCQRCGFVIHGHGGLKRPNQHLKASLTMAQGSFEHRTHSWENVSSTARATLNSSSPRTKRTTNASLGGRTPLST